MSNLKEVLPEIKKLEPLKDRILWRYTDIPSLIEILTYEYLPLIRVSRLSDPAEGAVLKSVLNKFPGTSAFGKTFAFDLYKNSTFISCWAESCEELAPMWERFSPRDGVAIKTDAERLLESLNSDHGCDIKCVEYLDEWDPDDIISQLKSMRMDEDQFVDFLRDLCFYKMSDFMDEREVRILKCKAPWNTFAFTTLDENDEEYFETHYQLEQLKNSYIESSEDILKIRIASMENFITEIIISPTARPGIFKIVNDLLETNNEKRASMGKPELKIKLDDSRRKMWF